MAKKISKSVRIVGMDDQPLGFGKHKGATPRQLLDDDPSYLCWLYENTGKCSRGLYLTADIRRQYERDEIDWERDDPPALNRF